MSARETLVRNISDTTLLAGIYRTRERRNGPTRPEVRPSHRWAAPRGKVGGHPIYGWQLLWVDDGLSLPKSG